ncbi:MAG: hypothetical protein ACQ9MH_14240 [Nitrospinales bacterium]
MDNSNQKTALEPTWGIAARVWWWVFWRVTLSSIAGGAAIGAVFGMIAGAFNIDQDSISMFSTGLGAAFGIFISILFFKKILTKDFGDFSIKLES